MALRKLGTPREVISGEAVDRWFAGGSRLICLGRRRDQRPAAPNACLAEAAQSELWREDPRSTS
jgi:hypothetical protein